MASFACASADPNLSANGIRDSGLEIRVSGFEIRVSGFEIRVSGFGFRVSGFGCRVAGFGERGPKPEWISVQRFVNWA